MDPAGSWRERLLGAVSGLYDKFLLGRQGFGAATVQAWFSIYLALLFLPLAIGWKLRWWPRNVFHWRWSIVPVSFALLIADFVYLQRAARSGCAGVDRARVCAAAARWSRLRAIVALQGDDWPRETAGGAWVAGGDCAHDYRLGLR
ncbi:MAG: hypothetical protein QM760_01635 [Nibricoccus sp.]